VYIFQSSKDGKFRGGIELTHEMGLIVEVDKSLAIGKERSGKDEIGVMF
jgi:glycyl-tRNA synthetase (class II)